VVCRELPGIESGWFPVGIATNGSLGLDGCTLPSANTGWSWSFCQDGNAEFIDGALFSSGALGFGWCRMPPAIHPRSIGEGWLDSRDIADIVMAEPCLSELHVEEFLWMSLRAEDDGRLVWMADRTSTDLASKRSDRMTFVLDARTGIILIDTFEERDFRRGKVMATRVRRRWQGGDWEELEPGDRDTGGTSSIH
jgi:hypothetical protein